jgi:hypothetical protein
MMLFPRCFWGDRDMFGLVQPDPARRGAYYLFYTYEAVSGGSMLAALVAGEAAGALEAGSDADAVAEVVAVLRAIFGPQGVEVPDPLEVRGSGGRGPWVGGAVEGRGRRLVPGTRGVRLTICGRTP